MPIQLSLAIFKCACRCRQLLRVRPGDPPVPLRVAVPAERLPADGHLRRHVVGLLPHPHRRRPRQAENWKIIDFFYLDHDQVK